MNFVSTNSRDSSELSVIERSATLRAMALEKLRNAVIAGHFPPGERLVERALCERMGVSRSIVREVLRHLEAEGLVESIPKQGPVVAVVNWDQARQIYSIRLALETAAVADCARVADSALKVALCDLLDKLEARTKVHDILGVASVTNAFYELIFHASGHQIAWDIVNRLNSRISRLRILTFSTADRSMSGPASMRKIMNAIANNDPNGARAACCEHIREAGQIAERLLSADHGL